jgi:protein ImuA
MNALFYNQLAADHPVVRDHVRLGAEDLQGRELNPIATGVGVATSFAVLDAFLPWRGWPIGAMTEIMTDAVGCGELSLLLPAMARLTHEKRPVLCIGSPHTLFAPALTQAGIDASRVTQINPSSSAKQSKENLWSAEQALKTGLPGMVVLWSPANMSCAPETLRRLHLSTLGRETLLIHFRGKSSMSQPSPAWLRFGFAADDTHIRLQVLKCRGRLLTRPLITLDRASVQARLYGQLRAVKKLDTATAFGLMPDSSLARSASAIPPLSPHRRSNTAHATAGTH